MLRLFHCRSLSQPFARLALSCLATMLLAGCQTGLFDLSEDPPQPDAPGDLRGLALAGDAGAQTALGQRYEMGIGVAPDPEAAFAWYQRAAEQGDPLGQYLLGQMQENGTLGAPDYIAAAAQYMRAASRGLPSAQAALGRLYEHGRGVPQSYDQAARWYALAAIQWDASARYPLGMVYATGGAARSDPAEAIKWYERAAALGVAEAQYDLGRAFELGAGVDQDLDAAEDWYQEAAEQGHHPAADALARLYGLAPDATPPAGRVSGATPPVLKPPEVAAVDPELPAIDPPPMAAETVPDARSPVIPAKPKPTLPPTSATPATGDYMVHLASYRKIVDADTGWGTLLVDHADLLGNLELQISRVEIPDKGTFFRLQAGPIATMQDAKKLCRDLETRDTYCQPMSIDP